MKTFIFLLTCCSFFFFTACKNDTSEEEVLTGKRGKVQVRFINFDESCNENLTLLNDQMVQSLDGSYESNFLYGNTWDFSAFDELDFGAMVTVKYKVLEECPYVHRLVLCNRMPGVPVEILEVE